MTSPGFQPSFSRSAGPGGETALLASALSALALVLFS